jgi:hypothetical protein
MKKNINKAQQQKALDFLANHPNPIIRQHARSIFGGAGPLVTKPPIGTDGMYPPPQPEIPNPFEPSPFPIDL